MKCRPSHKEEALEVLFLDYKDRETGNDSRLLHRSDKVLRKRLQASTHCQTICKQTHIEFLSLLRKCVCLFSQRIEPDTHVSYKYGLLWGKKVMDVNCVVPKHKHFNMCHMGEQLNNLCKSKYKKGKISALKVFSAIVFILLKILQQVAVFRYPQFHATNFT